MSDGSSLVMVSEGIANPTPCEPPTMAVVIPITFPLASRRGPPEFPGLIGALNWIMFAIEKFPVDCSWSVLPSWLIIPTVIDPERPNGFPITTTVSPTWRRDDEVKFSGWNSNEGACVDTTARSAWGSYPTVFAGYALPSQNVTDMLLTELTTW